MNRNRWLIAVLVLILFGIYGCGNDEGAKPAAVTGTAVINASGGEGTAASGGSADYLEVDAYADVKFLKSGTVDTSFALPGFGTPTANLGSNPLTISSNTTIEVLESTTSTVPAAGTPYMVNGITAIFISNGTAHDPTTNVTGLKVNPGVTLTLGLNWNSGGNNGLDTAYVTFNNDVEILGTVVTNAVSTGDLGGLLTIDDRHGSPATDRDKGALGIEAYRIITGASSLIDTSGADATTTNDRGGDGGYIYLSDNDGGVFLAGSIKADGGDGNGTGIGGDGGVSSGWGSGVYIWSYGVLVNKSIISANGGNGDDGGSASDVYLEANQSVYNTGNLSSNGGNATDGNGGNASGVYLNSYYASVFNSGNLTSNGGNGGGTGSGGSGGNIEFESGYNGYVGQIKNSGNLSANGGNSGTTGNGGSGGYFYFESYGGDIKTSGTITGNGGTGAGTGNSGGDGADMDIYAYEGYDEGYGEGVAPGLIQVTGNINLNGGSGPYGGDGGYVYVSTNYEYTNLPPTHNVEFVGYASVYLNGGNGVTSGGDGGDSYLYTEDAWYGDGSDAYPVGSIINELNWTMVGGAASDDTGSGGTGGYVEWEAEGEAYAGTTVLKNSGAIDVSGGAATGSGANSGDGGGIYFYGHDALENSGALTANGGDAAGTGGTGGDAAYWDIVLYASLNLTNTGTITAKGGSGTGTNGSGGDGADWVAMYAGGTTTNSGSIYAQGGNAGTGTGTPGDGGEVDLFSETTATINTAAIITVAKGTGGAGGASNGTIWIDWTDITPTDGTLP